MSETEFDEKLSAFLKSGIAVVGLGGAGCNVISWMKQLNTSNNSLRLIAANTDAAHLSNASADVKILLGEETCKGQGCSGDFQRGRKAALEALGSLVTAIGDAKIIYLVAGLGGGTGTAASTILSRKLKDDERLLLAISILPLLPDRLSDQNVKHGLRILMGNCGSVLLIDNKRLAKVAGRFALKQAFAVANRLIGEFIVGISEAITVPGLINLDMADLKAVVGNGGLTELGVGTARGKSRVWRATFNALNSEIVNKRSFRKVRGALVQVTGGGNLTLNELTEAGHLLMDTLPLNSVFKIGARIDPLMGDYVRVMVALTGLTGSVLNRLSRYIRVS